MSISYTSAYLELTNPSAIHTVSSLFELVGRVSGTVKDAAPGDTYLLFSGVMSDGVTSSGKVVAEIVSQSTGSVYDIGDTDVGKLLKVFL
jgi:hypothetical protein